MRYSLPVSLLIVSAAGFIATACSPRPEAAVAAAPATVPASAAAPVPAENVEATVTKLEHDWVNAIVKKDVAAVDSLLAPEFSGTSPTAHSYSRTMALEELKSGKYVVESVNLDEVSVNPYGNVAVAFTSQEEKSRYGTANTSGHYHYTDVWVKKDGKWQAVASHGTRYDKAH